MDSPARIPGQPALDQPLTDSEYARLTTILDHFRSEDAMNVEEMDGFFAALICGPVTVPPSVYLKEIWGRNEAPFAMRGDLEEFLSLAMRHWNFVAQALASADGIFLPWFEAEEGEEIPRGNRWAKGFLRGINLCREGWNEIFEDKEKFAVLLPVLALVHENDPDPELRSWEAPPDPELRKQVLAGLSVAAPWFYNYFSGHRTREPRPEQTGAREQRIKIGRNDPCYCGSGKKYKRCCGNVTIH